LDADGVGGVSDISFFHFVSRQNKPALSSV
jgi:hypothetical protein